MSIEAMKLALEAIQDLRGYRPDIDKAIEALRTAIQQEEAQKPATGAPVWCVATGERVNGEETFTHHDAYVPLADCFPLYTHQAPSVPDDMVRDAERWRTFLATRPSNTHEVVNAAIDAAMLAAK